MKAGAIGVIQECRYVLHSWIPSINMHYGSEIPPYPDYLIRYNIAILRGAARHFGGDWGVSIYGHTELRIMPQILTLAYDMGAKYFWFWTTAHAHHMPYPEQVNLSRLLKGQAERNPNRDMDALLYAAKAAIAIPEGYTFGFYGKIYMYGKWNMEYVNESGVTYRQVMHNAAVEMERLLRMGVDFDIVQDADGFDGEGYEEVIYIRPDATIDIVRNGVAEHRDTPRTPPRPHLQAKPEITATAKQSSGNVELDATPSGGCPPLGLNILVRQNTEWTEVIWEHYLPSGDRKILNGSKHTLKFEASGTHRFRAVTADAYGSIADKWFNITVK